MTLAELEMGSRLARLAGSGGWHRAAQLRILCGSAVVGEAVLIEDVDGD